MLHPGQSFDGYRILRQIGVGGFGEIWLCQSGALGDLRALKFIPTTHMGRLDKEFHALCLYRNASGRLRSPALMPIEHANLGPEGLFYIMPLADGTSAAPPSEAQWQPKTLSAVINQQKTQPVWFSSKQIQEWMSPLLEGLQLLSDAGLVHRDVKPDNVLFLNSSPCLSDISLLGEDAQQLTHRGTPGFSAPSWFVESGGHPDMYGAAMMLYSLLSGNPPDKMGRSKFRWPPQGEAALSQAERERWLNLHAAIRRAIDERPSERFADFNQFARALAGLDASSIKSLERDFLSTILHGLKQRRMFSVLAASLMGFGLLLLGFQVAKLTFQGLNQAAALYQHWENQQARKNMALKPL